MFPFTTLCFRKSTDLMAGHATTYPAPAIDLPSARRGESL